MEYYAGALSFSARLENDWASMAKSAYYRAQGSQAFLDLLKGSGFKRSNKADVSGSEKSRSRFQSWYRQPICNRCCSRAWRAPV
jgi:hypothetical protein